MSLKSITANLIRESCKECVEKHLGAAWILCCEMQDGYQYRLLVIGHLHEAESESMEWPELHNAIRGARKNFQENNILPDFYELNKVLTAEVKGCACGL